MTITLDAASVETLNKLVARGAFPSVEAAVSAAVETLAEDCPDDWLFRNREAVRAAVQESLDANAREEGYSAEEALALLDESRARRRSQAA